MDVKHLVGLLNSVGPLGTFTPSWMRDLTPQILAAAMKDTAHGVSRGMSADVIGAPVDLASQAMTVPRYLGAPTPDFTQSPVGGSQWIGKQMESIGLLRPQTGSVNEMAGRGLGALLTSPGAVAGVGGMLERAAVQASKNAVAPRTLSAGPGGNQLGAVVWHGSPHKFDKFDSSKIGTGEGAQAYGHGLYLADKSEVANDYRKSLSKIEFLVTPKEGKPYKIMRVSQDSLDTPNLLDRFNGNLDEAIAYAEKLFIPPPSLAHMKRLKESGATVKQISEGNLYKVDLPDDAIAKMLDWDKPLSQQPPNIQQMFAGIDRLNDPYVRGKTTTGEALGELSGKLGGREKVSDFLLSQGIPGIRYLDGGSRGAGQGSSNYVVFPGNEGLLQILERNGKKVK